MAINVESKLPFTNNGIALSTAYTVTGTDIGNFIPCNGLFNVSNPLPAGFNAGNGATLCLNQQGTAAKKQADMNANKNTTLATSGSVPSVFGLAGQALLGANSAVSGTYNQSNSLTGAISVTAVEMLPNGNLRVRGEKLVTSNRYLYIRY